MIRAERGIEHFEKLPLSEFKDVVSNLCNFYMMEKVDGSNLHFGIDDKGFFTSREKFGGERVHDINQYPLDFKSTYMRSAHSFLESILPSLKRAGLRNGSLVEAEVLYGPIPNVVSYNNTVNKLVLLHSSNAPSVVDLSESLNDTGAISLKKPKTLDGRYVHFFEENDHWRVSGVHKEKISNDHLSQSLKSEISKFMETLSDHSGIGGYTHYQAAMCPLNKKIKSNLPWDEVKEEIKYSRSLLSEHKSKIVRELMSCLVHNKQSFFGEDGSWIEGVVLECSQTGQMVKLVDKNTFTEEKSRIWRVRESLVRPATKKQLSETESMSFMGKTLVHIASALGHPELGTTSYKKYISNVSDDINECATYFSENLNHQNIKNYIIEYVDYRMSALEERLEMYLADERNKLNYCNAVHERTLSVFAETFIKLENIKEHVVTSKNSKDIVMAIIGKHYENQ